LICSTWAASSGTVAMASKRMKARCLASRCRRVQVLLFRGLRRGMLTIFLW
jgi:hypothetical protein